MRKRNRFMILAAMITMTLAACQKPTTPIDADITEAVTTADPDPSAEADPDPDKLPAVGDKIAGFTVTEQGEELLINAPAITFTHDKSGGTVYYVAAPDLNRFFSITFRTPTIDDKGLPHVFEHITISGSEKYPSPSLYFAVANQTFNTDVGAITDNTWTSYQLASLSQEQLLAMSDYFLDGVFHPMVYTEERLFKREAWRYDLTDPDAPLTITGTVYNEMRGNDNIYSAAMDNLLDTLYPGSVIANNCGGDPDFIPDIEWQDLLDFHDAYYQPSNALVLLYGEMDYEAFLTQIDGYFSEYELQDIEVDQGTIEPIAELADQTFFYPADQDSSVEDAAVLIYGIVPAGLTDIDQMGLSMLSDIFNHESSPMMTKVREVFPNIALYSELNTSVAQPYLYFQAEGLNESDQALLKQTINEVLLEMTSGIDASLVESVLTAQQFQAFGRADSSFMGSTLMRGMAADWSVHNRTGYYNRFLEHLDAINKEVDEQYFEQLIKTYLLDNPHSAMTATVPEPGGAERKAAEMAEEMAGIKAEMSSDEIEALIAATADLSAWSSQEPPSELVEQMQVVEVENLPEELQQYEMTDRTAEGVRYLTAEAATPDMGFTYLFLDASDIALEDLHYYKLLSELFGSTGSANHSKNELTTLTGRYLNGFSISATRIDQADGSYLPALGILWRSLNGEYEQGLALINEVLTQCDLTDLEGIKDTISNAKSNLEYSFHYDTDQVISMRAYAVGNDAYAYSDYLNGLEYYKFLNQAEKELADNPDAFLAKLQAVHQQLINKEGAVALYAGNQESIQTFENSFETVFQNFSAAERTAADYAAIPRPGNSEAIIADTTVQFNVLYAPLEDLGLTYSSKLNVLGNLLYESYLTPQIRHTIGAYDNVVTFNENGLSLVSFRDPGIVDTYTAYAGMGDFIRGLKLTQAELNRYILSAYGTASMPRGELTGALMYLLNEVSGKGIDTRLKELQEMKTLTVEDLEAFGDALDKLNEIGVRMTGGSSAVINEHRELFETVIPFNQISTENSGSDE